MAGCWLKMEAVALPSQFGRMHNSPKFARGAYGKDMSLGKSKWSPGLIDGFLEFNGMAVLSQYFRQQTIRELLWSRNAWQATFLMSFEITSRIT